MYCDVNNNAPAAYTILIVDQKSFSFLYQASENSLIYPRLKTMQLCNCLILGQQYLARYFGFLRTLGTTFSFWYSSILEIHQRENLLSFFFSRHSWREYIEFHSAHLMRMAWFFFGIVVNYSFLIMQRKSKNYGNLFLNCRLK